MEVQSLAAAAEQRHVEVLDGAVVVREHSGSPLASFLWETRHGDSTAAHQHG